MLHSLYLGSSIAISWAWGTSLILGMQIAQTKGLEAFSIWATANCLTLVLFGWLYRSKILKPEVLDLPYIKPKISDFGAVDDERKRSIFLWHMQTPGISGVDFYVERL